MKRIIISKCSGQFGNQLWMFANVLAFAFDNQREVHAPSFYKFAPLFEYWNNSKKIIVPAQQNTQGDHTNYRRFIYNLNRFNFITNTYLNINLEPIHFLSKLRLKGQTVHKENLRSYSRCYFNREEYQWLVNKILSQKTVMFQGFMFCSGIEQMKAHQQRIAEIFKPQPIVQQKMSDLKKDSTDAVLIGIHMRRGDYRQYRGGKYFYEHSVYLDFMRQATILFPDKKVKFFLCSDERIDEACFSEFDIALNKNGNAVEDMYLLSACNYIIGPPSTFSKWASYYGNVPIHVIENPQVYPALPDFKVLYNHYY